MKKERLRKGAVFLGFFSQSNLLGVRSDFGGSLLIFHVKIGAHESDKTGEVFGCNKNCQHYHGYNHIGHQVDKVVYQ